MNRTKYMLRATLLLLIVLLLINLFRETEGNISQIAKFKIETLNKIRNESDSLSTEQKLDSLVKETTRFNKQFVGNSPHVKNGLRYLIGAVVLLAVIELVFFILRKRRRIGE